MKKEFLLCIFIFGLLALIPNTSAIGESWLDDFDNRKAIVITGASGAGTNYQLEINITYDSDMQTDFDDVRFTEADGITELDYWIQEYTASTYAMVWVEVRANLTLNQTIYMYYGNSTVSTTSNGLTTFPFFDDFDDNTLNATKWYEDTSDGTVVEIANDVLVVTGGVASWETYGAIPQFGSGHSFMFYSYFSAEAARVALGIDDRSNDGNYEGSGIDDSKFNYVSSKTYKSRNDGTLEEDARTSTLTDYTVLETQYFSDKVEFYEDRVLVQTHDTQFPDTDVGHHFAAYDSRVITTDWALTRKVVDVEPSYVIGEWNEVEEVIIYFSVPYDYWGLNMVLVFGGLILMLVSVCIVAVKVRDRTITQDSGMLFLVLFCVGWGLFIGGTLIG